MNPWYTSNDLIAAVQRKISFPIDQNTFSNNDILAFANEEMFISQVPTMLQFHEEYFVTNQSFPLIQNKNKYAIPNRAIGMRLRGLFWEDANGNLFDMTRINPDDKAFFQRNVGANQAIYKFYFEGNHIVLTPSLQVVPTGNLVFEFFLRPNQLVTNDQAAIVTGFASQLTVTNTTIADGDTVTIMTPILNDPTVGFNSYVFTARVTPSLPFEFQIGSDSITTASNLTTAINNNFTAIQVAANNGSPAIDVVTFTSTINGFTIQTSNALGFAITPFSGVQFSSIPSNIGNSMLIDFLQTLPGHKTYKWDVMIPPTGISGNIIYFNAGDVPSLLIVGDYICNANNCIIPQIPPDLHNGLAERTCARILEAQGAIQEMQAVQAKIADIDAKQGTLLDNRSDGNTQKVNNRRSLIRLTKMGVRRRF